MGTERDTGPDGKLRVDFFEHMGQVSTLVSAVVAEFIGTADGRDPSVIDRSMSSLKLAEQEKQAAYGGDVPRWHPLFWELHVGNRAGTFRCPQTHAGDTQFQVMSPLAFMLAIYDQHPVAGEQVRVRVVLNGGESTRTYRWPGQLDTLAALTEAVSIDLDPLLAAGAAGQVGQVGQTRAVWRFGRVAHTSETGPPLWVWPRLRVNFDRRGVSVQAGWRLTVHGLHWVTPQRMRPASPK